MTEETAEPESEPMPAYEPKTDEQIKEIAQKLQAGHIYTSEHIKQGDEVGLVFMAFALSGPDHADWMQENEIAVLYQDLDKAAPRSINGMPCFFSHQLLTLAEWKRVQETAQKIQEAVDSV